MQTSYKHLELHLQESEPEEPVSVTEVKGSLSTTEIRGQSQTPLTVFLSSGGWREREKAREDSWGPPRDSRPSGDREWDRDKDRDESEKEREFDRERDFDRDDRFRRPRSDCSV